MPLIGDTARLSTSAFDRVPTDRLKEHVAAWRDDIENNGDITTRAVLAAAEAELRRRNC